MFELTGEKRRLLSMIPVGMVINSEIKLEDLKKIAQNVLYPLIQAAYAEDILLYEKHLEHLTNPSVTGVSWNYRLTLFGEPIMEICIKQAVSTAGNSVEAWLQIPESVITKILKNRHSFYRGNTELLNKIRWEREDISTSLTFDEYLLRVSTAKAFSNCDGVGDKYTVRIGTLFQVPELELKQEETYFIVYGNIKLAFFAHKFQRQNQFHVNEYCKSLVK